MEDNKFFKWVGRINSALFLLLLILSTGFLVFQIFESKKWGARNTVELTDTKETKDPIEDLRLGNITKVCGKDVQYVQLTSTSESKKLYSGSYGGSVTRNIVFFVGADMDSHWLFDTDAYLIDEIDQLKKKADDCKDKETVAIYYEIRKDDTDHNGKLDENDSLTVALTTPDGHNYKEIDVGAKSVLDHSIDTDAAILTLLVQHNSTILMKKYSLATSEKISEKEITRIGKK